MTETRPLAVRMRPEHIDDVIGQKKMVGENGLIRKLVEAGDIRPLLFYGTPGIGKTTLAIAISKTLNQPFEEANAAIDGKKTLQALIEKHPDEKFVLFVDEIHRLTKTVQDYLLKYMESGDVTVIGATTENPHISVTPAIRSRLNIIQLEPITESDVKEAVQKALDDTEKGLGKLGHTIDEIALQAIARLSGGDIRQAYNILEFASLLPATENRTTITLSDIEKIRPEIQGGFDKDADNHYNLLSAFQKSIRGSDVNASLYYLARLINSGDIVSALRRIRIIAYEDIGVASPSAVDAAIRACEVAEQTGLPEARIPLSYAATTLALAPKSNMVYKAIDTALSVVQQIPCDIPMHLRDTHFKGAETYGHTGYKYPHDYPYNIVSQQYLPDNIKDMTFLEIKREEMSQPWAKTYQNMQNILKPNIP